MKKVFIEFLNKHKNYKLDRRYFNSYESALHWGKSSLHNFHIDMIKHL